MMRSTSICPEVSWTRTSWRLSQTFRFCNPSCLHPQLFSVRLGRPKNLRISTPQFSTISLRTLQKRDRSLLKLPPQKIHNSSTYLSISLITSRNGRAARGIIIGGTSLKRRYRMRWTVNLSKMRRYPSFSCSSGSRINPKRVFCTSRYNRKKRARWQRLQHLSKF